MQKEVIQRVGLGACSNNTQLEPLALETKALSSRISELESVRQDPWLSSGEIMHRACHRATTYTP